MVTEISQRDALFRVLMATAVDGIVVIAADGRIIIFNAACERLFGYARTELVGEEKDLVGLYKTLGKIFRERCEGWKLFVFTGNAFLARQIGLKHAHVYDLFNGKIPCRLLCYQ